VNARAEKSTHPLDWLLWFGGAQDDEAFEKFVTDSAEKTKREWDERLRDSPLSRFDPEDLDWSRTKWKLEPAPTFSNPARRSR
jgi:hypothetical protein